MRGASVGQRVADIAAAQWGMITTAQARAHGVARANIAYRVRVGELERTDHYGVYRLAALGSSPLDDLRAAWLSTNPGQLAPERTGRSICDAVVASAAAALVHGIGDVYPSPYSIIVPSRRQSTRGSIAYSWRHLEPRDVEIVDGLPVTTRERTIVDLLHDEGDISIAADALRDAVRDRADLNEARFAELLMPHAERLGQARGDGLSALAYLKVTAEVDVASEAATSLERLLEAKVLAGSTDPVLRKFAEELPALAAALRASPNAPSGYGRQL
ncbi:type IV toxin-antitoxin system AbiEi family antitoxin domain-containing protein [Frigoribacterium sp. ACAM 257]|uniref:type IV toxin-antitoxin system AbiEi family antitoxin domain-containing protein n=1 Tax=Frigoribacterium sp. ACAM 257 TaxID=2508998 RepID=UPI0011B96F8C|nr:type IV toxin-antitoxin system AbiEi family antitoxin domain-containing protein [Frigoribacterium sp. ACAM 257]TWX37388.1 type IV toxin-antitoxin system AbiEi family antitoxin domain-containing protein [Frigoribacterium sp. ACAM 257]